MTVHSRQRRPDEGAGPAIATSLQVSGSGRDTSDAPLVRPPRRRTSIRPNWVHAAIPLERDATERRAA